MTRPDWDSYFLAIAKAVAARGDCTRAQHGAVIVRDNRIVGTGYNGTAQHAEQNAVAFARYEEMREATVYVTGAPCDMCQKLLRAAGIARIVHA